MANVLDLDDPNVLNYYGAPPAQATPGAIDLDVPAYYGGAGPYQPNPGAPNYQPNPGAAMTVAPLPPQAPPVLGAQPPVPKPMTPEASAFKTGAQISSAVANAPPPQPLGPTAADDAAFDARKSQVMSQAGASMRGGGGPVNTDPYGINAANRGIVGSLQAQHDARGREVNAEADRIGMIGEHKELVARMQRDDATIAKLEEDEATQRFESQMQQMQQQLDDVRSKKVDPSKYMKEHDAYGFFSVIGGVIGGLYQGLNKLDHNPFLVDLQGKIDQQMAADEKNIANERSAVGEQANLLAMNRAVYKDKRLADQQTRAMYLQAAQTELESQLADTDSEIAKAKGAEGLEVLNHVIAQTKKQIGTEARAQAAAAAAAMYARQKERQGTFKEIYKEGLDKGLSPSQAEYEAMRVSAMLYAPQELKAIGDRPAGGEYDGMTVRDRSHMKREEVIAQKEAEAELAALRTFKSRTSELSAGSKVGEYWSGLPSVVPGVDTAKSNKLSRESYNATVARAYDAAMKAAQGAAPTESQKAQLKTFYLENNDDDEIVAKKINAAEEFVVQAGRAKGLHESTPRETSAALGEKPIK